MSKEPFIKCCPNCNGFLVLRQNKKYNGFFLGCTNWDYGNGCTYTTDVLIDVGNLLAIEQYTIELCSDIQQNKSYDHLYDKSNEIIEFICARQVTK